MPGDWAQSIVQGHDDARYWARTSKVCRVSHYHHRGWAVKLMHWRSQHRTVGQAVALRFPRARPGKQLKPTVKTMTGKTVTKGGKAVAKGGKATHLVVKKDDLKKVAVKKTKANELDLDKQLASYQEAWTTNNTGM